MCVAAAALYSPEGSCQFHLFYPVLICSYCSLHYSVVVLILSHVICLFFQGPGSVLFQVLCKPSDSGDSDWSLLAGGWSDAQGVYLQS